MKKSKSQAPQNRWESGTKRQRTPGTLVLDLVLLLFGLALVVLVGSLGSEMTVSFHPSHQLGGIDPDLRLLPYDTARSCMQMFLGLAMAIAIAVASLTGAVGFYWIDRGCARSIRFR